MQYTKGALSKQRVRYAAEEGVATRVPRPSEAGRGLWGRLTLKSAPRASPASFGLGGAGAGQTTNALGCRHKWHFFTVHRSSRLIPVHRNSDSHSCQAPLLQAHAYQRGKTTLKSPHWNLTRQTGGGIVGTLLQESWMMPR